MDFATISQLLKLRMDRDDKGVTTVEYAVMIIVVAAVVLLAGGTLGTAVGDLFTSLAGKLK